jgi:hypothetical protein
MGKKPLVGLAGLCLAGLIVCGCQDNKQYGGSRRSSTGGSGGVHVPAPTPAPGGSPTASGGWDTTPKSSLTSRPGGSTDLGSASGGSGLGSSQPLGGSTSGLGSSNLGGMKSPAGGMPGATASGLGDTGNLAGSSSGSGLGSQPSPMGVPAGMSGPSHGMGQTSNLSGSMPSSRLGDAPPASGMPSSSGMPASGGFGASGAGSTNSLLTPPPPPAAMRPTTGSLNMSDPGAGTPSPNLSQQSNMTGGYRTTVPPGLGASPLPAPPPVPTVNNGTEQ